MLLISYLVEGKKRDWNSVRTCRTYMSVECRRRKKPVFVLVYTYSIMYYYVHNDVKSVRNIPFLSSSTRTLCHNNNNRTESSNPVCSAHSLPVETTDAEHSGTRRTVRSSVRSMTRPGRIESSMTRGN